MPHGDLLPHRRQFLASSMAAAGLAGLTGNPCSADTVPVVLPAEHRDLVERRRRRIVVQHDAYHVMRNYAKLFPQDPRFDRFRDALFAYVDEPGSQVDAVWWDIGGSTIGPVYPSKVLPSVTHPLLLTWLHEGRDWVRELVQATRERKLEVFWNHRISEVDGRPEGGLEMQQRNPAKQAHPDWLVRTWWWQGLWNLASEELRQHKLAVLKELATNYDLDGIQVDFARHVPCLPVGQQWALRDHVTRFLRMVREMLLEVASHRGRPFLLAAKVPHNLAECHTDGFDIQAWVTQNLLDVLTLGSRTLDVDVASFRAIVGRSVQLQPCIDDHHASDGYRSAPIEVLRGVSSNQIARGADGVVTFNWSIGPPETCRAVGGDVGPDSHRVAFREIGDPTTLKGKAKAFVVERRGGYPWAEGAFGRNDNAPLPTPLANDGRPTTLSLRVCDIPQAGDTTLRLVLFQAFQDDSLEIFLNGQRLPISVRDADWKDPQIFSPRPQPASGGDGNYPVSAAQRLLRIESVAAPKLWRDGPNDVEIRVAARGPYPAAQTIQLEKLEAWFRYSPTRAERDPASADSTQGRSASSGDGR